MLKVLVANKIDKGSEVQVDHEEGRELAKKHGLEFFMCSAKSGEGVETMFN